MFYAMETVRDEGGQLHQRALRQSPLAKADVAQRLCDRSCKDDNQPFVMDAHRRIIYTAKAGKDFK